MKKGIFASFIKLTTFRLCNHRLLRRLSTVTKCQIHHLPFFTLAIAFRLCNHRLLRSFRSRFSHNGGYQRSAFKSSSSLVLNSAQKSGFTLAEIMIALVVIGVITSILLPVAFNNVPNENIMKFKKGNATLAKVINELVSSDKYYRDGDLGVRTDGNVINGKHDGDYTYFCSTFTDMISLKNVDCKEYSVSDEGYTYVLVAKIFGTMENTKLGMDNVCKIIQTYDVDLIQTIDDIYFYQSNSKSPFGISYKQNQEIFHGSEDCLSGNFDAPHCKENARLYSSPKGPVYFEDENGMDRVYKIFCMDTDGINKGEDPFGYGIRADGKILLGKRADEWLEKSIQEK